MSDCSHPDHGALLSYKDLGLPFPIQPWAAREAATPWTCLDLMPRAVARAQGPSCRVESPGREWLRKELPKLGRDGAAEATVPFNGQPHPRAGSYPPGSVE